MPEFIVMFTYFFMMNIKTFLLSFCICMLAQWMLSTNACALHVTIIESQSYLNTDVMDVKWKNIAISMGYTASVVPQTTLDNSTFFATTDVLIISSGSIALPANRVATIQQFLQTGKPVFLQGEYQCSLSTNQAFSTLVNTLGGTFSWGGTTNGIMQMNILGSFANAQIPIQNPVLDNFNFGCHGTGCGIQYFLERNGLFYGYFFCPPNPTYGRLIQITDQDWINGNTNDTLMKNVITHLVDPALCSATNFTPTNLGNDTTLCNGSSITLNATNSNATYLWQNGSTNPIFTVNSAGTYWVRVTNNCGVFSDTIHINYAPSPVVNLGNDTTSCAGHPVVLNATTSGATYLWQDGSTNPTFTAMFSGIFSVKVTIGGCSARDTIIINFFPSPLLELGDDTTLCDGQSILLNAGNTPGAVYHWQNGAVTSTYPVTQAGTYSVDVTTGCGTATDSIHIAYKPIPEVFIGNDTIVCEGNSFSLNAFTPNAAYEWDDQSVLPMRNVNNAGLYWVDVTVDHCSARDSIQVDYQQRPIVSLGDDVTLCLGDSKLLNAATPNAVYQWQDNSIGSTFKVTEKGLYWVIVNVNNCIGSDSIFVDYYEQSCNCKMLVPNAFSPNRDGKNDEFKYLVNENNIELKEFIIFDRWGGLAFKSQNINDSWDGAIKGSPADIGAYYYQIRYKCNFTGEEFFLKGDVTLLR